MAQMENYEKKETPRYLFNDMDLIIKSIKNVKKIHLFLDYDGTLVVFQNQPNKVKTPANVHQLLQKISENSKFDIIIITGRKLNEVKSLLNIENISIAAVHGLHMQLADETQIVMDVAKKAKPSIKHIKNELINEFHQENDILIEDKEFTIAFHYRNVLKEKINTVQEKFIQIIDNNKNNAMEIVKGDKVFEVRPIGWNKGNAVDYFLNKQERNIKSLPIYIGDDATDEDAFKYLKKKGITIYVKNDSDLITHALYWLQNPDDVIKFLQKIELV